MKKRNLLSREIIDACLEMTRLGLNQGTAGNISCRYNGGMLITPTSQPYESLTEQDIVWVDANGQPEAGKTPSSEWRFHAAIYQQKPEVNAVVHNHAPYATTISILNRPIPAIHYMVALAGGPDIPCADYATYGTQALSDYALDALRDRTACLLRHHGMIATSSTIDKALRLAHEVELLARLYWQLLSCQPHDIPLLPAEEIAVVKEKFKHYGIQAAPDSAC